MKMERLFRDAAPVHLGRARGSIIIEYLNTTLNTVNTVVEASACPLFKPVFWLGRRGTEVCASREHDFDSVGQFLSGVGL
jgi:hypothetical protein